MTRVQRYLAQLDEKGLIRRIPRKAVHGGRISNEYDLSGMAKRLKELEPEFREFENDVKARRRAIARPGGLRHQTKKTD